jgi:hypothetical protein
MEIKTKTGRYSNTISKEGELIMSSYRYNPYMDSCVHETCIVVYDKTKGQKCPLCEMQDKIKEVETALDEYEEEKRDH